MKQQGIAGYRELVARSTADIEWFWNAVLEDLGIEFYRPFDTLLDTSDGIPWSRWFAGGQVNLAHNCLDRHARSGRRDHSGHHLGRRAGGGPPVNLRRAARRDLPALECAQAVGSWPGRCRRIVLADGPGSGDRFPGVRPASAAIAVPIFSGFGAPAVAARLEDSRAKVLITADISFRLGNAIPMEQVATEAAPA